MQTDLPFDHSMLKCEKAKKLLMIMFNKRLQNCPTNIRRRQYYITASSLKQISTDTAVMVKERHYVRFKLETTVEHVMVVTGCVFSLKGRWR